MIASAAELMREIVAALVLPLALASAASAPPAAPEPTPERAAEALWEAAREGDAAKVRELLAGGADPDREFRDGGTALVFAAQRGHAEVVRELLAAGADPDAGSRMNRVSALHFAVGHPEVVALLVGAGADPNVEDLQVGATPLGWAVHQGCGECLEALLASPRLRPASIESAAAAARAHPRRAEMAKRLEAALATAGHVPAWPQFRGPRASGTADGAAPPLSWNVEAGENVRWKTPVPGLGHSSPVIWGDRVFVTTAVPAEGESELGNTVPTASLPADRVHRWRVYCLDRGSGEVRWQRTAFEGLPRTGRSLKNSYASETPATDGERLVVSFGSQGLYAYSLDGELLWQRDLGVMDSGFFFDPGYQWGTASSPVIWRDLAILQVDVQEGSFLAAFDLASGETRWRTPRDELPSWGTPTIWEGRERTQVVTNGIKAIRGYDAATGEELWRLPTENSMISAATPVAALDLFIVGNGYRPLKPIYAIRTSAQGELTLDDGGRGAHVAWSSKSGGPYLTTPLVYGDLLYVLAENAVLTVYHAATGERVYRHRVGDAGARFTASPVAADGRIYLAGEDGEVYVVQAGLEYRELAVNPVGELMMATPAIAGGTIVLRGRGHVYGIGG